MTVAEAQAVLDKLHTTFPLASDPYVSVVGLSVAKDEWMARYRQAIRDMVAAEDAERDAGATTTEASEEAA